MSSYQAFQCPNCKNYVSTLQKQCRFCSLPLTDETKSKAVEVEKDGNRQYRLKAKRTIFFIGTGILALGLVLLTLSIISIFVNGYGYYFPWSPIIVLFGIGQMLIGLEGMFDERKKKKKNV